MTVYNRNNYLLHGLQKADARIWEAGTRWDTNWKNDSEMCDYCLSFYDDMDEDNLEEQDDEEEEEENDDEDGDVENDDDNEVLEEEPVDRQDDDDNEEDSNDVNNDHLSYVQDVEFV